MSNVAIVAIPEITDYVNKISSEKVPHMTLLFLGEANKVKNLNLILDFVKHASSQSLKQFALEVDHRGELGPDRSDVLFFSKNKWSGFDEIKSFRSYLLKNDSIKMSYDSAEQFPEWIPHITLGHPDNPARIDNRDYPGINHIRFDRIAVWFNDFDGIEFSLKSHEWDMAMSSDTTTKVEEILEHHGIKGMKWGRRSSGKTAVTVAEKRKKLKTSGGEGHSAHPDAVKARTSGQIAKKSGLKALSNQDLQAYNQRLNLEQQAKRLTFQDKSKGRQFVSNLLGKSVKSGVDQGARSAISSTAVRKKIATGAAALALA